MTWYLSKAELRRDASVNALAGILLPKENDQRVTVTHKLLWMLFADGAERSRDFLWREAEPGHFLILSARVPEDRHNLFKLDHKPFAPVLSAGDELGFSLRANPTVAIGGNKDAKIRGRRADVVMNAIKDVAGDARAEARTLAVQAAGAAWLEKQGAKHGFKIERVMADRYNVLSPPHRRESMRIASLDFDGFLRVTDPDVFTAMLTAGLGRAKAYGCGLMLIRRV